MHSLYNLSVSPHLELCLIGRLSVSPCHYLYHLHGYMYAHWNTWFACCHMRPCHSHWHKIYFLEQKNNMTICANCFFIRLIQWSYLDFLSPRTFISKPLQVKNLGAPPRKTSQLRRSSTFGNLENLRSLHYSSTSALTRLTPRLMRLRIPAYTRIVESTEKIPQSGICPAPCGRRQCARFLR